VRGDCLLREHRCQWIWRIAGSRHHEWAGWQRGPFGLEVREVLPLHGLTTDGARWLFIMEGAGTMVAGLVAVALLPDFPSSGQQKWLTEQEQRFSQWRLARAANDEVDENGSIREALRDAFIDPKAWMLILIQFCQLSSQTWTYFFPVCASFDIVCLWCYG
jgi:hypothetical protein